MSIYTSNLINSILNKKNIDASIKDSKTWKEMSFFNFVNNSIFIANFLINKCNLKKWEVVIAFTTNPITYSILVLGTLMAWGKFVILEPSMWEESMKSKIRELQPKVWFYDFIFVAFPYINKILSKFWIPNPYKIKWLKIISIWTSIFTKKGVIRIDLNEKKEIYNIQNKNLSEDADGIIVFTWGTTDNPKWVIHSHKSIFYMLEEIKNITINSKIFYADMPQFILLWMMSWKDVIVWRNKYSNKKLLKIINNNLIDTLFSPPYKFNDIVREKLSIPNSLQYIFFGSAPVYTWFLTRFYEYTKNNIKIYCIYGMTEMLPIAIIEWREKIELQKNIKGDILWYPLDSVIFRFEKDKELLLTWNHVSQKYLWKNVHTFIYTWDLVEIVNYNWKKIFTLLWRKKDMIIRREYNIYPSLYEKTINNIPFIKNAAFIWIWNEKKEDEDIILCIELEDLYKSKNDNKIKKDIFNLITQWIYSIDNFAIPDKITLINIPCSGKQNKVNKILLKNNYLQWIWK